MMRWQKLFGSEAPEKSYGQYAARWSPDRRHALVFDPGFECRMCCCEHRFLLIDSKRTVVEPFKGLDTVFQKAWWTPDSRIVGVAVWGGNVLLFYRLKRREYALLGFGAYMLRALVASRGVHVDMDPTQFRGLFGDTPFKPPRSMFFPFTALRWKPAPAEWKLGRNDTRGLPHYRWFPPPSKELKAHARKNGLSFPGC